MVILAVALPFKPFIKRFPLLPFRQFLADAQPACNGMQPADPLFKPADPAAAEVIIPMAAEDFMHLVHKVQGPMQVLLTAALLIESQVIADGKGVGPQVTANRCSTFRQQTGPAGEFTHDFLCNIFLHQSSSFMP
jgi:hypothetical protein